MALALDDPRLRKKCKPGTGRVYRITTTASKKGRYGYVGQTRTSLYERFRNHVREGSCCRVLGSALKKYGKSAFVIEVVESDIPLELLSEREIHWIAHFQTYVNGYNCTIGGDYSPFADPHVKARADAARKTPKSKAKLNASLKASWDVEGARDRQSQRSFDLWNDPMRREEMIQSQKRGHQDPAVKLAKSKISKAKWADPEWVAKQTASSAKARAKPGHFEKHSAASKKAWTPERRAAHGAKCRATILKKKQNVERQFDANALTENDHLDTCTGDDGVGVKIVTSLGSNYDRTEAHSQAGDEDGDAAHTQDYSHMIPSDSDDDYDNVWMVPVH